MVKITRGEYEFYMDGYERRELDAEIDKTKRTNDDTVIIVIGREGVGKSVKAMTVAKYLDPTFEVSRVVFNAEDYHKACLEANKYQAIVFDEAFRGMGSTRAMSKLNNKLKQIGQEMRQKNLFHIIVLPSLFLLEKYWSLHRADLMYYIYANRDEYRKYHKGYFRMYDGEGIRKVYVTGEKTKWIPNKFWIVKGRFTKASAIDMVAYQKKKSDAFQSSEKEEKAEGKRERNKLDTIGILIRQLKEVHGYSYVKLSNLSFLSNEYLSQLVERERVKDRDLLLKVPGK